MCVYQCKGRWPNDDGEKGSGGVLIKNAPSFGIDLPRVGGVHEAPTDEGGDPPPWTVGNPVLGPGLGLVVAPPDRRQEGPLVAHGEPHDPVLEDALSCRGTDPGSLHGYPIVVFSLCCGRDADGVLLRLFLALQEIVGTVGPVYGLLVPLLELVSGHGALGKPGG